MGGLFGGGAPSGPTPAESQDEQQAAKYLAQYKTGKPTAADQAVIDTNNANQTAAILQSLANSGMLNSGTQTALVGTQLTTNAHGQRLSTGTSAVSAQAENLGQQMIQNYLKIGQAYLGLASGQAEDIEKLQQEQQAQIASSIGSIAASFASIYGSGQMEATDINPGEPNVDQLQAINYTPQSIPSAPNALPPLEGI